MKDEDEEKKGRTALDATPPQSTRHDLRQRIAETFSCLNDPGERSHVLAWQDLPACPSASRCCPAPPRSQVHWSLDCV